jgi:hypothetical protein
MIRMDILRTPDARFENLPDGSLELSDRLEKDPP